MKTSVLLTENQESPNQFSIVKQRNLFVSDFNLEPSSVRKTERSLSPRKQWIKMSATTSLQLIMSPNLLRLQNITYLRKIFKRVAIVVRACTKLMILQKNKRKQKGWLNQKPRDQIDKTLKEKVINEIVLKWCQGVCKKSLSSLKSPIFDFIKNVNKQKADLSKMQLINAIKFLTESLAYYTHPHYIDYNLKGFLSSQLYQDFKSYYTYYVSERSRYKIAILDELIDDEISLISMEIILFNLCETIIQEQKLCNFSKIILISTLQFLYKDQFDKMLTIIPNNEEYIQGQIEIINNQLQLNFQAHNPESLNLIEGLLQDFEIVKILEFNSTQMNKIRQYFNIAILHLRQQID